MRRLQLVIAVLFLWLPSWAAAAEPSDAEIRQLLIERSIAAYPGRCPCPYTADRAGKRCGQRSAYSKQGGYAPLCYASDITEHMLREHRLAASAR